MTPRQIGTAGRRLLLERKLAGLSRAKLAALLSCSERTVFDLETGQTTPRLETAVAIEQEFGIPVEAWVKAPDTSGSVRKGAA